MQVIFLNFTGSSLILILQSSTFPNIYNTLISRHLVKSVQIRTRKTPYLDTFHAMIPMPNSGWLNRFQTNLAIQLAFCSKLTIESTKQSVKSVQS